MPYFIIVVVAILVTMCAIFASKDPRETAEILSEEIINKELGLPQGAIESEIDKEEK